MARPKSRKQSLINRTKDYYHLQYNPGLLALHRKINLLLYASATQWTEHDYGEGYCYQSMDRIGVSGLRNTRARIEAMGLMDFSKNKSVIDIGCNTGFLALHLAESARKVIGCDINPRLVDIGKATASYLELSNVELVASAFEDFSPDIQADVILSLANHSTYDGNTKHTLDEYFAKCHRLVKPDGLMLFESHHPKYEADRLEGVCSVLQQMFTMEYRKILHYGTKLDRGRTFIVARPKPDMMNFSNG